MPIQAADPQSSQEVRHPCACARIAGNGRVGVPTQHLLTHLLAITPLSLTCIYSIDSILHRQAIKGHVGLYGIPGPCRQRCQPYPCDDAGYCEHLACRSMTQLMCLSLIVQQFASHAASSNTLTDSLRAAQPSCKNWRNSTPARMPSFTHPR